MAAVLVVGIGGVALWRQQHPTASDLQRDLVTAVGARRFFEPRLTGGFRYGIRVVPKRGSSTATPDTLSPQVPTAGEWEILAAAARIKRSIEAPRTSDERSAVATASFLVGNVDEAIAIWEGALSDKERDPSFDAQLLTNLSAAYLTRAIGGGPPDDFSRSLDLASRAVDADPTLREALFNRAMALEYLFLRDEGIKAWRAFLKDETDPGWAGEASRRLKDLELQEPGVHPSTLRDSISRSLARGDANLVAQAVDADTVGARDLFEFEFLPGVDAHPELAQTLASAYKQATNDPYQEDTLVGGDFQEIASRARIFAAGRREFDAGRRAAARQYLERVVRSGSSTDPLSLWSRQFLVGCLQNTDVHRALQEQDVLIALPALQRYPSIAARSWWQRGILQTTLGRYESALDAFDRAARLLGKVRFHEFVPYMQILRAEALSKLGNRAMTFGAVRESLRGLSLLREPKRRAGVLITTEQLLTQHGLERAAAEVLQELAPLAFGAGMPESLPLQWVIDNARSREAAARGAGLLELQSAPQVLAAIRDPSTRSRMEHELSVARGEFEQGSDGIEDLARIDEALGSARARGADFRLPELLLARGRALLTLQRQQDAIVALGEAIEIFEGQQTKDEDLGLASAARAEVLYATLVDSLVENAPPRDSLDVAERYFQLAFRKPGGTATTSVQSLHVAPGQAVLAIFVSSTQVIEWLIASDGIQLAAMPRPDLGGSSENLGETLLQPFSNVLTTAVDRLVVVPHPLVQDVDIGAVLIPKTRERVAARLAVSLAPTLEFAFSAQDYRPPTRLLAFADPDTKGRMPRLPGAAADARAVAAFFADPMLFLGSTANLTNWNRVIERADAIFVATHTALDSALPMNSRLLFAGDGDGDLTAHQLAASSTDKTSVAVLAACQTAKTSAGAAGVFSFVRPALRAGMRSVFGAVDFVPDEPSAEVRAVFEGLARGARPSAVYQSLYRRSAAKVTLTLYAPLSL